MELIDYIRSRVKLDDSYIQTIESNFKTEIYKKGAILQEPENYSKKVVFIQSGLMRMYYQIEDKVITFLFLDENAVMLPLESIFYNKPDPYGWEILHDSVIRSIHFVEYQKLVDSIPAMERFTLLESFKVLKQMSDKLYSIQFQTAEERYANLLHNYPDILQKASLGQIASYIGVTQQTLSVIRAKKN